MKIKAKNISLGIKLNIIIIIIAVIIFASLGIIVSSSAKNQVKTDQKLNLTRDVKFFKNVLQETITEFRNELISFSKNNNLVKELQEGEYRDSSLLVSKMVKSNNFFDAVVISNAKGIVVAGIDRNNKNLSGMSIRKHEYWKRIQKSKVVIENFADKSKISKGASFDIAAAVRNQTGKLIGAIAVTVNIEKIHDRFLDKKFGTKGYMVLFDNKGTFLTHPQKKLILKNFAQLDFMKNILNSNKTTGQTEYVFQGIDKYLAYTKLEIVPWYLVTLVEMSDILAVSNSLTKIIIIAGIISTLILIFASFIVLTIMVSRPLGKMVDKFKEGAKGDFNISMKQKSNDEIGVLAKSFNNFMEALRIKSEKIQEISEGNLNVNINHASEKDKLGQSLTKMVDNLNEILSEVNAASDQVSTGAEEIAASSQSLSQGASEQASSVEQISATSNEINNQAKLNSENINVAKKLSEETYTQTNEVNQKMDFLLNAVEEVNKSSEEIKKITKVIDDIAFQINLLALNANVEAARAGKYGKGFAVVAEEVRNLAMKSADSVKETSAKVENAIENIGLVSTNVNTLYTTLKAVSESSSKVNELMMEVDAATNEQANAIEQIDSGLTQIETVTESNTANAEETAATSEELSAQAKQLSALISRFKLRKKRALPVPTGMLEKLPDDFIKAFEKTYAEYKNGNSGNNDNGEKTNESLSKNKNNNEDGGNNVNSSDGQKPEHVIMLDNDFENF